MNGRAGHFRQGCVYVRKIKRFWSQIMLVLSRRVGEEIVIGDTMRVIILGVQGSRIRIGVSAPPHISIQRGEVRDRIATERSSSSMACLETLETNGGTRSTVV